MNPILAIFVGFVSTRAFSLLDKVLGTTGLLYDVAALNINDNVIDLQLIITNNSDKVNTIEVNQIEVHAVDHYTGDTRHLETVTINFDTAILAPKHSLLLQNISMTLNEVPKTELLFKLKGRVNGRLIAFKSFQSYKGLAVFSPDRALAYKSI